MSAIVVAILGGVMTVSGMGGLVTCPNDPVRNVSVMEASATVATDVASAGLTAAEAQERCRRGEANSAVSGTTRSYAQILRSNVFSFFNTVLFVIGIALLVLGRYSDAFTSVGLGLVNAVISALQEIRAKRKLDRL